MSEGTIEQSGHSREALYNILSAALSKREGMEPDDLLWSRNARPKKDGEGAAKCPSCSQNAHDEAVLTWVKGASWRAQGGWVRICAQ
jgi:hypothetical protein